MIFSSNLFKFRNDFVELSTTWKVLWEAKVLLGDGEIFLKIHRIKIETFIVPFDCWFLFYLAAVLSKQGQLWEKLDKSCSTMLNTLESIFELKAVWVRERYGIRDERPVKFTLSNICLTFYETIESYAVKFIDTRPSVASLIRWFNFFRMISF